MGSLFRSAAGAVRRKVADELTNAPRTGSLAWLAGASSKIIRRLAPRALQKGFLECFRAVVLLQKIGKSLISEFLEAPFKVACESLERKPGLVIKLDAFALQYVLLPGQPYDLEQVVNRERTVWRAVQTTFKVGVPG